MAAAGPVPIRDQKVPAPLKLLVYLSQQAFYVVYPGPKGPGPIEAHCYR